jgi:multiple sugar transport system permease protein
LSSFRKVQTVAGIVCAFPSILGFFLFVLGPAIASAYFSFTRYTVIEPPEFIGIENYRALISEDLFRVSFYNTIYLTSFGVLSTIVTSLALALLLNQKLRGISIYRTIFFVPSITPLVANAVIWTLFLNGKYGLINYVLSWFGVKGPAWLADPRWAKPALIIMGIWGVGQSVVIYLAGLQGIPLELYEAAEVDGAGIIAKFKYVTWPLLSPTTFFILITSTIAHFQMFVQPYVMTQGGPADATMTYVYLLYNKAFGWFKMGEACAMAWMLFILVIVLTLLQFYFSKKWVHYEIS